MTERYTVEQMGEALRTTGGLLSAAAQKLGCSPSTVRAYIDRYPELTALLEEVKLQTLDLAEGTLLKAIGEGSLPAVIFFLKCKGKERGYIERQELSGTVTTQLGHVVAEDLKKFTDAQLEDIKNGRPPRATSGS